MQTAIMEDLQKTEDSLAPVVDFNKFKSERESLEISKPVSSETSGNIKVGPYSSRYPNQCQCCPCHHPAPMWPEYPQYPWHFPQPFFQDWTYRPYQQPIYFGIGPTHRCP